MKSKKKWKEKNSINSKTNKGIQTTCTLSKSKLMIPICSFFWYLSLSSSFFRDCTLWWLFFSTHNLEILAQCICNKIHIHTFSLLIFPISHINIFLLNMYGYINILFHFHVFLITIAKTKERKIWITNVTFENFTKF